MTKIKTLKNPSGESFYPLTSTNAVVDENGNTIEDRLVVADGEDLVTDGNVLRLKNRPNTDGMGYVILRKEKTFQEQVTKANTIYEIRYEFDLGGAEVTIPEGCMLKFEGGSLRNGKIRSSISSTISSGSKCLDNVFIEGFNRVIYAKWYGDDLGKIFPYVHNCELHLDSVTYNVARDILVGIGTRIIGHNSTIISNAHIYLGWRVKVEGVHFISTKYECLSIIGEKIYESRQDNTDYEDKEFLIIGTDISNCIFDSESSAIIFESSLVENSTDKHGFNGSGFGMHVSNNTFNECGDDTIVIVKQAGWFTSFVFDKNICNSRNVFLHAISDKGNIAGISIVENDIQLTPENQCAIKLEAASSVCITDNRFWDFYDGVIEVSRLNCNIQLQIPNKGDNTAQYIKWIDKYFEGDTTPSSVNVNTLECSDFIGYLAAPTNVDDGGMPYYKLADFISAPLGNYAVKKDILPYLIGDLKDIASQTLSGVWILNISRPIYRQVVLTLYPTVNVFGYGQPNPIGGIRLTTFCNTMSSDFISYSKKIDASVWAVSLSPFAGPTPTNVVKGMVYYDTTRQVLAYVDENKNIREYDGNHLGVKRAGTWSQRPNADGSYLENGYMYFLLETEPDEDPDGNPIESLTGNGKAIWWIQDGRKWVDAAGATVTG